MRLCLYTETPPARPYVPPRVDPLVYIVADGTYAIGAKIPADVSENVEDVPNIPDCSSPCA